MNNILKRTVLIDTCFWFAFYDANDQYHNQAIEIFETIEHAEIVIPWPTFYEVLNTRFVKQRQWLDKFEKFINRSNIYRLDDKFYKEKALEATFRMSLIKKRDISLVDHIIRQILSDENVNINYLVTFNKRDFVDVLTNRRTIQIYPEGK